MSALHAAPAEADAPDPDRAGPELAASLPDWFVHFAATFILFLLRRLLAARPRRACAMPSWWSDRPGFLPLDSVEALAASIRGPFGYAIAGMCRHCGIGPGHQDWPELSRAILAFGGSLHGLDGRKCPQPWWENPAIIPGMIGAETNAPSALAVLLSRQAVADSPPPGPQAAPVGALHPVSPVSWRQVFARAGTGPPTGPPAARGQQSGYA